MPVSSVGKGGLAPAHAGVVDQQVVTDQNVTSSRWPDDLPAFCARIVEQFAAS